MTTPFILKAWGGKKYKFVNIFAVFFCLLTGGWVVEENASREEPQTGGGG